MITNGQNQLELLDDLYMETVLFSYIINDNKNIKGVLIDNLNIKLDNETVIFTGGDSIEIIYPYDEINDIKYDELNNHYILSAINGVSLEFTII